MDLELSWILLGLPIAFVFGWAASRLDLRQLRFDNRQAPKAYFKGLNYLLNEQQDQAIDAFIEAVQSDPDTSELHFALGNLFRRRGEYQRAVRVHEHLLSRGDLAKTDLQRAQHALALDFLKAGLLDRAEDALRKLEGTPFEAEARLALLAIYERSREWSRADEIAQQLEASGQGSFGPRRAHYLCEQAVAAFTSDTATGSLATLGNGQDDTPLALLKRAIAIAPQAPRPRIELARLQQREGDTVAACRTLEALAREVPEAMPLIAHPLAELAAGVQRGAKALDLLRSSYADSASLDVLEAIVALESAEAAGGQAVAREWYVRHLEREPSLVAAAKWLAGEKIEHEQFHPQIQRALDRAVKPLTRYRCAACGFEAKQYFWQCPGCQSWDSYPARRVEEL